MKNLSKSWTLYSVGLFVVWAIVLTTVWLARPDVFGKAVLVFVGYCLGWLSATLKHFLVTSKNK